MEHQFPPEVFADARELFLPSHVGIEPLTAIARALSEFNRDQLGSAIEVLIALMDVTDGDTDDESEDVEDSFVISEGARHLSRNVPGCPISDAPDPSVTEWHTRGRYKLHDGLTGKDGWRLGEDDEDDDSDHGLDEGEPNFVSLRGLGDGPGCSISDPDYAVDDVRCDDMGEDMEREQMSQDVPMLPVYSLDHNVFNDQRVSLGISNLMSSFVGRNVRSADSGERHTTMPGKDRTPGSPV